MRTSWSQETPLEARTVHWGGWAFNDGKPHPVGAHYRCIFDGVYAGTLRELMNHFHDAHGRVL